MAIALLMDVHVPYAITEQLRRRGVDVATAQGEGAERATDEQILELAAMTNRVIFTHDIRFRKLAERWQREAHEFSGLLFGHPLSGTIGQFVRDLELIAKASDLSDWENVVERLPL